MHIYNYYALLLIKALQYTSLILCISLCLCTIQGLIGDDSIKRIYMYQLNLVSNFHSYIFYLRAYMEPVRTMRYSIVHLQFCVHGCSDCCYFLMILFVSPDNADTHSKYILHFKFYSLTKHDLPTYMYYK